MIDVRGGQFSMGSDRHYPEEAPAHEVIVDGFKMDRSPVTNAQFAAFVAATGHITLAEIAPDPSDYPGMPAEMARAGSLIFAPPLAPIDHRDPYAWWRFEFGANWRRPYGADSNIERLADHPVVHVAYADAAAFAAWAEKRLPTEAEWECAARGGLHAADYAWGSEFEPGGQPQANYWQGVFPWQNRMTDGFDRTSPVGSFAPNGFGLLDMIGNVWEWTSDWYAERHAIAPKSCCVPRNPRGGSERASRDLAASETPVGRRVLKGGSHLCAVNYCQRFRPAARLGQPLDTSTSHVGFRCAMSC